MFKQILGAAALVTACATGAMALEQVDLGGDAKGDPSVVWYQFQGADYVAAFVRGKDGLLQANVGNPANGDWTGWVAIGDELLKGSPSCVATTPQLIDCVAMGANNAVMHVRYNSKLHQWSEWESIGGYATSDPSAVRTSNAGGNVLNIFVRGPENLLFWNEFKDGDWSDWQNLETNVGTELACTDIFVAGAHCYDTSGGSAVQLTDVTHWVNPAITTEDLSGAIEGKVSGVATGAKGDTLRLFVNGPGHRLWFKKWKGSWAEWQQLPVTVNGSPACAMKKSGGVAVCLSIESDGTTKAILIGNSEI